ncbi:MAG: ATPase synthesis protein 25 mitochondrial [Candelina mexicana]|nr:MAG: ATPase synthesis protein 25 mitochondrial [Candelina mexicana]
MAVPEAVRTRSLCNACRMSIISLFTTIAKIPPRPAPFVDAVRISYPLQISPKGEHVRAFTRSSWHRAEQKREISGQSVQALRDVALEPIPEQEPVRQAVSNEQLPWYLQVQTPQPAASPLFARQSIPEVPSNSPDLLHPLLEHISIDLGLDNLTLFDLRELDPPPALGTNLLMVLGTARSEKHLHVSADRLCRWLRTSHTLSPYADGLLGRNELKLKLRRRARRTKLLSSVGASDRGNTDDGIRTGWICVNVGRLENGPAAAENLEEDGIVGFGSPNSGVKVVVQMLTEEKRNEIDLESLWGGMLERKARREAKMDGLLHQSSDPEASDLTPQDLKRQASSLASAKLTRFLPTVDKIQTSQRRAFHSVAHTDLSNTAQPPPFEYDESELPSVEPRIQHAYESIPQQDLDTMTPPTDPNGEEVAHQRFAGSETSRTQIDFANAGKALTLRALLNHLRSLPREDAQEILGRGSNDATSTSFLASFHNAIPPFPSYAHWECRIEMHCYAVELGHPGYSKSSLLKLLHKIQESGVDISEETLQLMFETILNGKGLAQSVVETVVSEKDIGMAMHVLETMSSRGYNVVTEGIIVLLHEAVHFATRIAHSPKPNPEETSKEPKDDRSGALRRANEEIKTAQTRLRDIMEAYKVNFTKDDSYIRILRLYAIQGHWDEFWDTWDEMARRLQPRSEDLYEFLFRTIAHTSNQKECMQTLRAWVPEMEREQPPVLLKGQVAGAVQECLLVADPWVAEDAESEGTVNGEWIKLWRRCEQGLKS